MKFWKSISFLSIGFLLILFSLATFAEGTGVGTSSASIGETILQTDISSGSNEKNTSDVNAAVIKGITTEAVWFGVDDEVTIATRHETHISKAPSIVTVITDWRYNPRRTRLCR